MMSVQSTSTSTSLHYAVILDNSLVVRKKETKEKIEKIEVLDQSHKTTCEECKIEKERSKRKVVPSHFSSIRVRPIRLPCGYLGARPDVTAHHSSFGCTFMAGRRIPIRKSDRTAPS